MKKADLPSAHRAVKTNMSSPSGRGLAAALLLVFVSACSDDAPVAQRSGPPPMMIPAVEAVVARVGSLPLEERLTGRTTALNQTEIYPEVSGPIMAVFVNNGDQVKKGDPLVQLRDSEYNERLQQALAGLDIANAQTRQAEADLELLRSQLRQTQEMIDRNLEARSTLETIQSQVAVAEANVQLRLAQARQAASVVEERQLQRINTTVLAPIDGTVGQRNAEIGQLASTSNRLFVIGDLSKMRVEMLLSQRMLNYISPGMPVTLHSDSWDVQIDASITRISPFLDPATTRTQAHIDMDNPNGLMRPGMFLTVDIFYGQSEQAVLIPNSALYRHPRTGIEGVYVIENGDQEVLPLFEGDNSAVENPPQSVSFKPVQVIANGRMSAGVRGVDEGDWVITVGQNLLQGDTMQARTRLIPWDRMMQLQAMESRDMFEVIERQRQANATPVVGSDS